MARLEGERAVTVDFGGVSRVTYSFADEFAGKLSACADVDVAFSGMAENVAHLVNQAVDRRATSPAAC